VGVCSSVISASPPAAASPPAMAKGQPILGMICVGTSRRPLWCMFLVKNSGSMHVMTLQQPCPLLTIYKVRSCLPQHHGFLDSKVVITT
jgi:hypothetical protein